MKPKKSPSKQMKDETDSWPFIRWNEGRQRWMVDARTATGGKRTFHETKAEAETTAQIARIRKQNEGSSAFDDRELAKYGWTVQKAIRFAVEHLKKQEKSVSLAEAVAALIEQKKAEGKTPRYQRDLRNRLSRLAAVHEGTKIATITTADLDEFLASLNLAPGTANTFRRDIRTLWSFAERRGWGVDAQTAKHTGRASAAPAAPAIFTPEDAAAILAASSGDVLAFHAVGLFAGLRVAEILKLDWRDVDFESGLIEVTAKNSKTRRRRLVPMLDNLRAWLSPLAKPHGPVIEPAFRKRQEAARNAAGYKPETAEELAEGVQLREWPQNALRHSFVSYRLAATGNAAQTALESGHDQGVLFQHYRELVRPKDAARYFAIMPEAAANVIPLNPSQATDLRLPTAPRPHKGGHRIKP